MDFVSILILYVEYIRNSFLLDECLKSSNDKIFNEMNLFIVGMNQTSKIDFFNNKFVKL